MSRPSPLFHCSFFFLLSSPDSPVSLCFPLLNPTVFCFCPPLIAFLPVGNPLICNATLRPLQPLWYCSAECKK
ncbi:hypothetical protein CRG98_009012, partial [Punica granatum]